MKYVWCFVVGGIICSIGQILIDKTKLTSARILVLFVTTGAILTGLNLYPKIVEIGGAGATVPLTGFGYSLAKGTMKAVDEQGLIGIFTGGIKATAAGISAAVLFGFIAAIVSKPKIKS
ncbi:MAG: stage V sporulation protein AE [Clostridia bacterium]|nr:stage V sporulation protein AE [Clostridia bacterium]